MCPSVESLAPELSSRVEPVLVREELVALVDELLVGERTRVCVDECLRRLVGFCWAHCHPFTVAATNLFATLESLEPIRVAREENAVVRRKSVLFDWERREIDSAELCLEDFPRHVAV